MNMSNSEVKGRSMKIFKNTNHTNLHKCFGVVLKINYNIARNITQSVFHLMIRETNSRKISIIKIKFFSDSENCVYD